MRKPVQKLTLSGAIALAIATAAFAQDPPPPGPDNSAHSQPRGRTMWRSPMW